MALSFKPKTENELSRFKPLPPGTYPFTILESAEQESKSAKNAGKLMVKLKLNVHGPDDCDVHVYDNFADWFSEWKLKHFCETAGLADAYEAGTVDASDNAFEGRTGFVTLAIEEASEKYPEKNSVEDYGSATPVKPSKADANAHDLAADDIPF